MPATRITWRDAQSMPDDGKRYEAIDGELYVTPAPRPPHQWVSMNLAAALWDLLVRPGHGRVFAAPVGVEFIRTEEGVQPDLLFVSTERLWIITEDSIQGPPDLVIEILSPSTARRDRTVKLDLYRRQQVPEYWIVDLDAKTIEVWRLAEGATAPDRHADRIPVRLGPTLLGEISLEKIFDWPR